ncbi:hypothetical protein AB1Y20_009971 [Prymnesium parvum]|uniref:Uncharacterized protein n=1 Tax=Prymnesium parvum TaxID=97485 RepID=A0AB34K2D2_PRYPA
MRLAPLLLLLCLTHASAECPVAHCVDNINGQGNFALELNESLRSSVVCVRGAPFLSQAVSPQLFLKIFDVQRVIVQCNNLSLALRVRTVSEDTRFSDVFRTESAVNRSVSSDTVHTNRATLMWDVGEKVYQMQMAWEWLRPVIEFVFGGTPDTMELRFSPFHTSCVIVEQKAMYKGTSFNVNVTTSQDGPFVIGRGQFLSEEEYAQQTAIATNSALTQLFSSPAYASWMLNNHHRMRFDSAHSMGSAEDDEQSDCSMHAES